MLLALKGVLARGLFTDIENPPTLGEHRRKSRNGFRFPKRSQAEPATLSKSTPEIVGGETKSTDGFRPSGTAFLLVISLEHPRLDAGMLLQPFGNGVHQ
jgi:hypothetical protein